MAVFKSSVVVRDGRGETIGGGMTYVHLRQPEAQPQAVSGTVSLQWWEPVGDPPAEVALADGRCLPIVVSQDVLSECSQNRIFRYSAAWPQARNAASEAP